MKLNLIKFCLRKERSHMCQGKDRKAQTCITCSSVRESWSEKHLRRQKFCKVCWTISKSENSWKLLSILLKLQTEPNIFRFYQNVCSKVIKLNNLSCVTTKEVLVNREKKHFSYRQLLSFRFCFLHMIYTNFHSMTFLNRTERKIIFIAHKNCSNFFFAAPFIRLFIVRDLLDDMP